MPLSFTSLCGLTLLQELQKVPQILKAASQVVSDCASAIISRLAPSFCLSKLFCSATYSAEVEKLPKFSRYTLKRPVDLWFAPKFSLGSFILHRRISDIKAVPTLSQHRSRCLLLADLWKPQPYEQRRRLTMFAWSTVWLCMPTINTYRVGQKNGATLFCRNTAQICTISLQKSKSFNS